jgi:hypothetical protein
LYKIPYRPDGEGEEFYMHETENHGIQFYRLHFGVKVKVYGNLLYVYTRCYLYVYTRCLTPAARILRDTMDTLIHYNPVLYNSMRILPSIPNSGTSTKDLLYKGNNFMPLWYKYSKKKYYWSSTTSTFFEVPSCLIQKLH